jgi:uncharacterized protein (DUF433 family)
MTRSRVSRLNRITVDPAIPHGKPVVRGMRIPVQTILELLASDMTMAIWSCPKPTIAVVHGLLPRWRM